MRPLTRPYSPRRLPLGTLGVLVLTLLTGLLAMHGQLTSLSSEPTPSAPARSAGAVSTTPRTDGAPDTLPERHGAHDSSVAVGHPNTTETVTGQKDSSTSHGRLGCHPGSSEPSAPHDGQVTEVCSSASVPGPPLLPVLVQSVRSADVIDDGSAPGTGPHPGSVGERAPPTLVELQLLRI